MSIVVVVIALVISVDTPWWAICLGLFVYGVGVGLATAQLTGVILVDVPVDRSGAGSGTQSTSRQVGSALGIAILGTVLFTTRGSQLDSRLDGELPDEARTEIVDVVVTSAGAAIPGLEERSPEVADAANRSTATVALCEYVMSTPADAAAAAVASSPSGWHPPCDAVAAIVIGDAKRAPPSSTPVSIAVRPVMTRGTRSQRSQARASRSVSARPSAVPW